MLCHRSPTCELWPKLGSRVSGPRAAFRMANSAREHRRSFGSFGSSGSFPSLGRRERSSLARSVIDPASGCAASSEAARSLLRSRSGPKVWVGANCGLAHLAAKPKPPSDLLGPRAGSKRLEPKHASRAGGTSGRTIDPSLGRSLGAHKPEAADDQLKPIRVLFGIIAESGSSQQECNLSCFVDIDAHCG